jgi:hypothetical protein
MAIYNRCLYENKRWEELFPKYVRAIKESKYFKLFDFDKEKAHKQLKKTIKNNNLKKGEKQYFPTVVAWKDFDFSLIDEAKSREIAQLETLELVAEPDVDLDIYSDSFRQENGEIIRELTDIEDENVQQMILNYYLYFGEFLYLNSLPFRINHANGVYTKKQYYYLVALYNRCIYENKRWENFLPKYAKAFKEAEQHRKIKRIFDITPLEIDEMEYIDIFQLLGFETPWIPDF